MRSATLMLSDVGETIDTARVRIRGYGEAWATASLWGLIGGIFVWAAIAESQLFAVGLVVGSILALGAIGLTLVYGILRFANFAHGDMLTMGAYVAFVAYASGGNAGPLSFGYGMFPALLAAALAIIGLSVTVDRLVFRPLRQRGSSIVILAIASLGVALIVRALVLIIWGPQPKVYERGVHLARELVFGVKMSPNQMFIVISAFVAIALVYLLLYQTKLGKAMRATADNPNLAKASGIDTDRVILATWCVSGALVATAGVLLGIQAQLTPDMGFSLIIPFFAAAILGGIGSPHGALVGAMVVGISQEASTALDLPFPPGWGAGYKPAVAFLVLIAALILRPQGLFGAKE